MQRACMIHCVLRLIGICILSIVVDYHDGYAQSKKSFDEPNPVGNFALPMSQQPGPFFAFGQNILEAKQWQIYIEANDNTGVHDRVLEVAPTFMYGVTDSTSILLRIPGPVNYKSSMHHATGLTSASLQVEHLFYDRTNSYSSKEASLVGAITVPTGSANGNSDSGYTNSTLSYFIGSIYNYTSINWMWFVASGATFIEPSQSTDFGSQYVYDFGIGRNIHSVSNRYIFMALLELNGEYFAKNKINRQYDVNSGGNILYATPSLFFSTQSVIVQLGISLPMTQHWYEQQNKNNYQVGLIFAWNIN